MDEVNQIKIKKINFNSLNSTIMNK